MIKILFLGLTLISFVPAAAALTLESPAFRDNEFILEHFTCDGENISPPLDWSDIPEGTKSLALIVTDPDAGEFLHWMVYAIPPSDPGGLEEGLKPDGDKHPFRHGVNDFKTTGYGGPCPPQGTHHYRFRLYALDKLPLLPPGAKREELLKEMQGHILEEAELTGLYSKKSL